MPAGLALWQDLPREIQAHTVRRRTEPATDAGVQVIVSLQRENQLLRQKVDLLKRRVFGSSGAKLDSAQLKNIFAQIFSGFFTHPFHITAQFGTAQVQHRLSKLPNATARRQSLVRAGLDRLWPRESAFLQTHAQHPISPSCVYVRKKRARKDPLRWLKRNSELML
jgi:hypothetical protein